MIDKLVVWLGAAILAAGVSAATVAGAGLAFADESASGDGASGTTSKSTDSTATEADSTVGNGEQPTVDAEKDDEAPADEAPADEAPTEEPSDDEQPSDEEEVAEPPVDTSNESAAEKSSDPVVADTDEPASNDVEATEPEAVTRDDEPVVGKEPEPTLEAAAPTFEPSATVEQKLPTLPEPEPETASFMLSAVEAEQEPAPAPTLINVIGTFFWGLFDMVAKVIDGPPAVPANFNVRVARSALEIDCGDGYTAEADWYVPISQEPPKGVIYFQHGFGTRSGFYNVTAAAMAQSTNSIVVVPSITSNIFACDACHLTGDPMHFAVAELFTGDRAALTTSLAAAFPDEDVVLPQKYVLAGHSGGSSFAAGVAGFASQLGGLNGDPDLVGVILFDTNNIGEFVSRGIAKVPVSTPVYYIGADPTLINNFDDVSAVMKELRPNQFTGVHVVGGTHADGLRTSNPLVRFVLNLAFGAKPQNIAATEQLAAGWINDMLSPGSDTGIYPAPGEAVDLSTESGTANVVGLGGPLYQPNFFESLIGSFYGQINNLRFGYCAADVDGLVADELANTSEATGRVVKRSACAS